jgi:hypothetical protein
MISFFHGSYFTKDRSFRVTVGNTFSTKINIENGIVQGAVISVTVFLIAMTDIYKGMEAPTKVIGYVDDWIIYTCHKLPRVAEARLKKAADKWTNENGFRISAEKKKIDAHPQKKLSPKTKTQD